MSSNLRHPSGASTYLHVATRRSGSALVISASGDIDLSNEKAWEQLLGEAAATTIAPGPVVVDIRNLDFIGSCAYAALARQAERCRRRGVRLCVVSHQPIVDRIVAVCGLRQMLPIHPTIQTALERAAERPSAR